MLYSMTYASGMLFPNILSQQLEDQDKDKLIPQNFFLKKMTIKGTSFRKDNF